MFVLFLISVDVKALKDCWLVGDEFLQKLHKRLQGWHSESNGTKDGMLFMYQQYNIMFWYKSPLVPQPSAVRIFKSFIDGLNTTPKLPKYILIFSDDDIIKTTKHLDFGIMTMLQEQLKWLFEQLNKYSTRRCDDLRATRIGALNTVTHEPRFIWVTMIQRPFLPSASLQQKKIFGLRIHFNELLREMVSHECYMYIMHPQIPLANKELFSAEGELTSTGQLVYWQEVNEILLQFDRHDMKLTAEELENSWKNQRSH